MGYCSWLVSCRLIRLNPRAWWGREKCLAQRLERAMHPGWVLGCGNRNKQKSEIPEISATLAWWLRQRAYTTEALVRSHKGAKCFSLLVTKLAFASNETDGTWGYVQITVLQACWWAVAARWWIRMVFVLKYVGDRLYAKGYLGVGS